MDRLQSALQKKRPQLLQTRTHILHDNASCHACNIVTKLLASYEWEVLSHPLYSQDVSPPDFDLFPRIKEPLRGRRFEDLLELNAFMANKYRY